MTAAAKKKTEETTTEQQTPSPETKPEPKETAFEKQEREANEVAVFNYLQSLETAEIPIRVVLFRKAPKVWDGVKIDGKIETYEEAITEDDILDEFGGGTYELMIYAADKNGSYRIKTKRVLKFAGPPNMQRYNIQPKNEQSESEGATRHALEMMHGMTMSAEQRARAAEERARAPRGPDPATVMARDEMRALREELSRKDDQLFRVLSAPKDDGLQVLLKSMVEGESGRMQSLRQQIESELRQKNDMHKEEISRLHARYESIATRQEEAHKREVDNLNRSNDNMLATLRASHASEVSALKMQLDFLNQQLATSNAELAALRARKDRTFLDTLGEAAQAKEALEKFGGGGDKEGGGSALERIAGSVLNSELAQGIAARVAGGAAPQPNPAEQQQPHVPSEAEQLAMLPVGKPVTLSDGRVVMRREDNSLVQLRKQANPMPEPTGGDFTISDEQLAEVLPLLEGACDADTPPEAFAATARNLAPSLISGPIGKYLRQHGVDALLVRVENLNASSTLVTQHGKNWVRKVVETLLSGGS
jgi:hypothetical protein